MQKEIKKSVFWAVGAGFSLLFLYFLILGFTQSFFHARDQFLELWYLILPLVFGFGVQVFLYAYIRYSLTQIKLKNATGELAASGAISTGSMIACCSHHLVDVLPLLGLSAAFLFLVQYQLFFILFGIASNIVGIIFMLEIIKKHSIGKECKILSWITKFNLKIIRNWVILVLIILLSVSFFTIKDRAQNNLKILSLLPVTNEGGGLSITVTPIDFSFEKPVQFKVALETHQGDLNFNLMQRALLFDEKNNQYLPTEWQGGSGGHHLSGTLVFPKITNNAKQIKLIIKDVYNIESRQFLWNLE